MASYPERIITTQWVLAELGNFLSKGPARRVFAPFVRQLQNERLLVVEEANNVVFQRALDLYSRRADKTWSFIDCTSFVVMKQQRLTQALTSDHHFTQAGFVPLLR